MPAWPAASPAVVIVRMPSMKLVFCSGNGSGSQRIGAGGISASRQGAVRHRPGSIFWKRRQCRTVGRMR
jgi:hypothetical protein